jgi:hypothetical protein
MKSSNFRIKTAVILSLVLFVALGTFVYASHSWGNYHWARTTNPFILKLSDNVSTAWDAYLGQASSDWSQSSVLDTKVVNSGKNPRTCRATSGQVEVCNYRYGYNGWLGVASIWISGSHITQGTVKVNDSYFNNSYYNTPPWRLLVMCQEIGHTFGLDHQDENFYNSNLGTCMDYTSDPDGPLSNEHPNQHDYDQLELIYGHVDSITTANQTFANLRASLREAEKEEREDVGRGLRKDSKGHDSVYVRDLGRGEKVFTFILWTEEAEEK